MSKTISSIIEDVRVCMDEIGKNDAQFVGSTDDSEMDTIIKSKIVDAYNFVYENADIALLGNSVLTTSSTPIRKETNSVSFAVDDELLRFVQAKMDSWKRSVVDAIYEDNPLYVSALDEYVGATIDRPMVLQSREWIGEKSETENVFTLVGRKDNKDNGTIWYIKRLSINSDATSIDIEDSVYRAVVYYCAGLTYLTFGDKDRSQELIEIALTMMGATNNKE